MNIDSLRRAANEELTRRGQAGLDRFGARPPHHATHRSPTDFDPPPTTDTGTNPYAQWIDAVPTFAWSLLVPGLSQFLQGRWRVGFGFLAAAWLGWSLGSGWIVHLAAAAEAAWHEYA